MDASKPAAVIVGPRAGHGPGAGGFKHDSEVGMSLHEPHETYLVVFFLLSMSESDSSRRTVCVAALCRGGRGS
ncbi:DUF3141 domain-containing protein [Acidovorax sp. FHTAMBA]|uniref:DUF3141 domain-containing protein n=1 Tax=unclassified Acidovorax TaxID=2684926 RepID=UPI003182BBD9